MGIYYRLLNDTKRECVHLDHHVKKGPMTKNDAVHFAICNYMMQNTGDVMRMCGDDVDDGSDYKDVDLLAYKFNDHSVIEKIVRLLNLTYNKEKYIVSCGVGVEKS